MWKATAPILLFLVILACYSNTFTSPPVLDDFHTFVRNPDVHLDAITLEGIRQISKTNFGVKRFIPMVSFGWDYWWGGGQFYAFHVTNTFVHLLCALALFFLTRGLLNAACLEARRVREEYAFLFAFGVTALWALHPVQTNAVTYLVQRMASIQALFFTSAVVFYLKARLYHRSGQSQRRAVIFYSLCALMTLAAFFSKENSRVLPIMLLLTEGWFFRTHWAEEMRNLWERLRRVHWIYWCFAALMSAWLCQGVFQYISSMMLGYETRHFTLTERLLTQTRIVVWYLSLLVAPLPSRLSLEHDVILSTSLLSPITTLLSLALLGGLAALIVKYRRDFPLATYGGAWFFLNLVIESSIVPLELVFEHRLYLPSMGLLIALVALASQVASKINLNFSQAEWKRLSWCALAILCSCLSLMTFFRNEAWQDPLTINRDNALKAPNHPRAHANYAVALLRVGQPDQALHHAERTLELNRKGLEDHVVAANVIVGAYMKEGAWDKAVERGEELLRSRQPGSNASSLPMLLLRIAESHRELGNFSEAFIHASHALELTSQHRLMAGDKKACILVLMSVLNAAADAGIDLNEDGFPDPGDLPVETWVARVLLSKNERKEAGALLERAAAAHPSCKQTAQLLAIMNWEERMSAAQTAAWELRDLKSSSPLDPFSVVMRLADYLRKKDPSGPLFRVGEKFADVALLLRPGAARAHLLRGWYHYERRQLDAAVTRARQAIELEPQYARAWLSLGFFLGQSGQADEAVAALEHALVLYPGYPQRRVLLGLIKDLKSDRNLSTSVGEADSDPHKSSEAIRSQTPS